MLRRVSDVFSTTFTNMRKRSVRVALTFIKKVAGERMLKEARVVFDSVRGRDNNNNNNIHLFLLQYLLIHP